MPKFPDGWFDYTNIGDVIQGTRLVTFKVPLKESFFANNRNVSENSRFTPTTLIESMRDRGLKLGLVVDLTYTTRYYDPEEFTSNGVQYEKIFVEGHEIPNMEVIERFYEVLDNFFQNSEEDSLVGVHCTHGVNRTGYVVCRYMVERLGMRATEALEAYKVARGYPVERMNYINDLKRRAGEHVDEKDEEEEKKQQKDRHRSHKRGQERGGNSYQRGRGNTHDRHDGLNHNGNDQGIYGFTDQQGYWNGQYNGQGAYGFTDQQGYWNGQYNGQGACGFTDQQGYWNGQYNDQSAYGYTDHQGYWNGQYNDQSAYGYTDHQGYRNGQYNDQSAYGYTDHQGYRNGQYNDQSAYGYTGNQQPYQNNRWNRQHSNHWENNPRANSYNRGGGHSRGFHGYNSGSDSRPERGASRGSRRQKQYRSRRSR